ncbi:hypothetical protein DEO72_LG7g1207 [Vigna unguiculata]|uniref:Uncharacterized protein n=1 Tax=Vigna unguiculata TaxID=3917 RepID=A0A4D6MGQ9_VIGUN|nr:hypothetical protein DEO72_LG7g1207 [Vigna unguiculata]
MEALRCVTILGFEGNVRFAVAARLMVNVNGEVGTWWIGVRTYLKQQSLKAGACKKLRWRPTEADGGAGVIGDGGARKKMVQRLCVRNGRPLCLQVLSRRGRGCGRVEKTKQSQILIAAVEGDVFSTDGSAGVVGVSGDHVPASCGDGHSGGDGRRRGWRLRHGDGRR